MKTAKGKNGKYDNPLLMDLEDYVETVETDFEMVGDGDIERVSSILGQSEYNNIIYAGPSGVGKTATLLGLAQRKAMATKDHKRASEARIPLHMVDRQLKILDVNTLFDSDDAEKISQDIKRIFAELERPGRHVLIIEDANDLLRGIENHQCHGLISAFMRELKKGEFQTIWEVREEPSQNKLEEVLNCHSEMRELFTVINKDEPKPEEIKDILKARKRHLEQHFDGLTIDDGVLEEVTNLTTQYPNLKIWMRAQPARSRRLLDRVASIYVSREQTKPAEIRDLEAQMEKVKAQIEDGETPELLAQQKELEGQHAELKEAWDQQAEKLYYIQSKMKEFSQKLESAEVRLEKGTEELREKIKKDAGKDATDFEMDQQKTETMRQAEKDILAIKKDLDKVMAAAAEVKSETNTQLTLTATDVQGIFSELSGIPAKDLNADETDKILNFDKLLKKKIFGQDASLDIVAKGIKTAKAGLKPDHQPMGSYIILGPSGVGKSYLAKCAAEILFGDKKAMTPFDMSEYMEKHTVSRLIGAPPGYAGYGQGGRLTNAVRRKPYQAILLDEVEKGHEDVYKILLQLLDEGRLSDELGTAKFNHSVVFMTTNLGQGLAGRIDPRTPEGKDAIRTELKAHFPPELLNRVDGFLMFDHLKPEHIHRIVKEEINDLNGKEALKAKGITIDLSDEDIASIVEDKYVKEEGARQVVKFLRNDMNDHVADVVLRHSKDAEGGVIKVAYDTDTEEFSADFVKTSEAKPVSPVKQQPDLKVVAGSAFAHA